MLLLTELPVLQSSVKADGSHRPFFIPLKFPLLPPFMWCCTYTSRQVHGAKTASSLKFTIPYSIWIHHVADKQSPTENLVQGVLVVAKEELILVAKQSRLLISCKHGLSVMLYIQYIHFLFGTFVPYFFIFTISTTKLN